MNSRKEIKQGFHILLIYYILVSIPIISIHMGFIITIRGRPCRISTTEITNWRRRVVAVTMTHATYRTPTHYIFFGAADLHLRQCLTEEVNLTREPQGTIVSIPIFSLSTVQKLFEQRVIRYLYLYNESLSLCSNVHAETTMWSHTRLLPLLPFFLFQPPIPSTWTVLRMQSLPTFQHPLTLLHKLHFLTLKLFLYRNTVNLLWRYEKSGELVFYRKSKKNMVDMEYWGGKRLIDEFVEVKVGVVIYRKMLVHWMVL